MAPKPFQNKGKTLPTIYGIILTGNAPVMKFWTRNHV